jgi:hypothetical protein
MSLSFRNILLCALLPAFTAGAALATDEQGSDKTAEPLEIGFSRAFGAPPDGSWDGLFSGDNVLDPVRYATEKPEQAIFKSAQYALSSTTAGNEIWYVHDGGQRDLVWNGGLRVVLLALHFHEDAPDTDESRNTPSRLPDDAPVRAEASRANLFHGC